MASGDKIDDEQVLLLESSRSREEEEVVVSMVGVLSLPMRLSLPLLSVLTLFSFGRSNIHCSAGSLAFLLTLQWPGFPVSLLCSSEKLGGDGPSCSFPVDDGEEDDG